MQPSAFRALIQVVPINKVNEETSAGGIVLALKSNKDLEYEQEAYTIGYVLDIGPGCFSETPNTPWFKIGDLVQFYKHSGVPVNKEAAGVKDEHFYRFVYDKDVQGVLNPSEDK